jgi:hypothetical protein
MSAAAVRTSTAVRTSNTSRGWWHVHVCGNRFGSLMGRAVNDTGQGSRVKGAAD